MIANMYKVIIATNDNLNKSITVILSKAQYNRVDNAKTTGGFLRYDVELYSDNEPKQKSDIIKALQFLSDNVFYCSVGEIQSFV